MNGAPHDPGPLPVVDQISCAHCAANFQLRPVLIGEDPKIRFAEIFFQLADHLRKRHRKLADQVMASQGEFGFEFSALMISRNFRSLSEDWSQYLDTTRGHIHQFTRKIHISDETIDEKVKMFGLDEHDSVNVATVIKWLRDLYEEKTQDPQPANSVILAS